ncbi:MAG: glycerophosphodiester phosphodiesterase [Bacteroidetes bacterium]|nr:glycerophosphodiester phosphodiesterase [Bacteroidota bacterium]
MQKEISAISHIRQLMHAAKGNCLVHGHRGARGHLPENTIPSLLKAIQLGAPCLEVDVVLSMDKQVVISHEPWMHHAISLQPTEELITESIEKDFNLFKMTYTEIKKFDCGSLGNPRFPLQQKMKAYKPLLSETIDACDAYARAHNLALPVYTIEAKSLPEWEHIFHPPVNEFAEEVYKVCEQKAVLHRTIFQSFDARVIFYLEQKKQSLYLAYLLDKKVTIEETLEQNKINPVAISIWHKLLDEKFRDEIRNCNLDLLCWTVNEPEDIHRVMNLKVDGIISDYPERPLALF